MVKVNRGGLLSLTLILARYYYIFPGDSTTGYIINFSANPSEIANANIMQNAGHSSTGPSIVPLAFLSHDNTEVEIRYAKQAGG